MPEFPTITRAELVATLSTGLPYSVMAERLGLSEGTELRWLCLRAGIRRHIRGSTVVTEIGPMKEGQA